MGTLATAVQKILRGAEAEASAVATTVAGSRRAVSTLANAEGDAAASVAAWRLRRLALWA